MIFSTITFCKAGLDDPPQGEADETVTGLTCAKWVISWLPAYASASFDREPIAEDWGYAVRVSVGADTLLLGFASAFEKDTDCWRIMVGDNFNRGVFPWTQRRRRNEAARLSDFVEHSLRSSDGVTNIRVERTG